MKLYLAPMNMFSNHVYRHLMLKHGVDYVFSELILISKPQLFDKKTKYFKEDLSKTIFQVGVSSNDEIDTALSLLSFAREININMDCPQSSMKNVCGALLHNLHLMDKLTNYFSKKCRQKNILSSVKIRLGIASDEIYIEKYLDIFEKNKIDKVYIHLRTLRYSYDQPAIIEPIKNLKKYSFPLILSGDVDNYVSAKKLTQIIDCDIMIGRAAFMNPFLFEQIKNKENLIDGPYNPIIKDPNIIRTRSAVMSNKKRSFIKEYEELAKKEGIKINLMYLNKGISKII
jgi:tRNA-dihydrouridine synthase